MVDFLMESLFSSRGYERETVTQETPLSAFFPAMGQLPKETSKPHRLRTCTGDISNESPVEAELNLAIRQLVGVLCRGGHIVVLLCICYFLFS
jgi:hypothetical protein